MNTKMFQSSKMVLSVLAVCGSAVAASAQSTIDITLQPDGASHSTLSWVIAGNLASSSGAIVPNGYAAYTGLPTFFTNAINHLATTPTVIPLTGFGTISNLTTGASEPLENLALAPGGNLNEMTLFVGAYVSPSQPFTPLSATPGQAVEILPGTASEVINLPFTDFNPGTYSFEYPGGSSIGSGAAFTTSLTFNLDIEPSPEPSPLALSAVAGLVSWAGWRRHRQRPAASL